MARKRMIDPNIWNSEDFARLSTLAKLVFIGMFSQADDEGRGRANPLYLKSVLFPYNGKIRTAEVGKALREIAEHMSVVFYRNEEKEYYMLTHWKGFQVINKPTPSKLPLPEDYGSAVAGIPSNKKEENEKRIRTEEKGMPGGALSPMFCCPDRKEVRQFAEERGSSINPEQFYDFYESKGWMVGNEKMRDWKAAFRNWERRQREKPAGKKAFEQHRYTEEDREKRKLNIVRDMERLAAE